MVRQSLFARFSKPRVRRTCRLAVALCVIWAVGCSAVSRPDPAVFTTVDWSYKGAAGSVLTSYHYKIYTTCQRKPFIRALPTFLETCHSAYARLLPPSPELRAGGEHAEDQPLKTYLFQRRRQWERFVEDFSPKRAETYKRIRRGGFTERGITVSHYGTQRSTLSILAHEGLHQYLEATGRNRIPAWINEGLACYFESFDLVVGRPVFDPANNTLRRPALRKALATDSLIPLREILATNAGLAVHQKARHVNSYYAQEWSLILFLLHSPLENPYSAGFRKLLDELGTKAMRRKTNAYLATDTNGTLSPGEAVFRAYVTDDLKTFELDYKKYLIKLLGIQTF